MTVLHLSLFLLATCFLAPTLAQERRLEPSHSFKSPFFLVRGAYLPHWEFSGSTVVTEEYVRLTPAIKSRTGSLWNTEGLMYQAWELELEFRIGGGGKIGADGMALWYTKDIKQEGSVFGMKDKWQGLAIIFDTFDNDGQRDNPQVTAVFNDGTKEWREDGKSIAFGGCHAQFRNPYKNIKAKVRSVDGFVEVLMDTSGNGIWEPCVPPTRITIPTGYHLGLTAATGGLFDNHDIYALETFSLDGQSTRDWQRQQQLDAQYQQQQQQQQQAQQQQQQQQQAQQQQQQLLQQQQPPQQQQDASALQVQSEQPHADSPFDALLKKMDAAQATDPTQPPAPIPTSAPPTPPPPPPPPSPATLSLPDQSTQQQSFSSEDAKDIVAQLASVNTKLSNLQQQVTKTPEVTLNVAELKQEIGRVKEQQALIVEGFSEMLRNVVTKADLDNVKAQLITAVNNAAKDQGDNRALLNDLKAVVNSKIGGRSDDILRAVEELNHSFKSLKQAVEQTQQNTRQIAGNLQQNAQDLTQTIEKHTTFGFWSYFLFVQAIFIFGYVWWRKHREDANKKLI